MDKKDEREFLHDLSTPLAVTTGMLETVLEHLQQAALADQVLLRRLNKAFEAVTQANGLVEKRRRTLCKTA